MKRRVSKGLALGLLACLLVLSVQAGLSARNLLDQRYDAALRWAPWSTDAHERASTAALLDNRPGDALPDALGAIALSPISVPAIRTIALARLTQGAESQGNRLMELAVTLGWRDPLSQLWAIEAAKSSGEPEKAVQRAEALFAENSYVAAAASQLLAPSADPRVVPLLVKDLAQNPDWRDTFFDATEHLPIDSAPAFDRVVAGLQATRAPMSLDEAQPLLDHLVARGEVQQAQQIWNRVHGQDFMANGNFDLVDRHKSAAYPKYWNVTGHHISTTMVAEPEFGVGNPALRISSKQSSTIISHDLMLRPGEYRFTYRVHVGPATARTLDWELSCDPSHAEMVSQATAPSTPGWSRITGVFNVPEQDCAIQRLALKGLRDTNPVEIWLDDIELKRTNR